MRALTVDAGMLVSVCAALGDAGAENPPCNNECLQWNKIHTDNKYRYKYKSEPLYSWSLL